MKAAFVVAIWLCCIGLCASRTDWRNEVPLKFRLLSNRYAPRPDAAQAGGKLYSLLRANGLKRAPSCCATGIFETGCRPGRTCQTDLVAGRQLVHRSHSSCRAAMRKHADFPSG